MGMTVYNPDGTVASVFQGIERDGNKLVLKQLALGQVPMDVIITPEEGLKSLGMGMSLGLLTFILLYPYLHVMQSQMAKGFDITGTLIEIFKDNQAVLRHMGEQVPSPLGHGPAIFFIGGGAGVSFVSPPRNNVPTHTHTHR